MNGMVTNAWPYVAASYALTWIVLLGYGVRLWRLHVRLTTSTEATR